MEVRENLQSIGSQQLGQTIQPISNAQIIGENKERRKEMFYLTTLDTFLVLLYGVRHMVEEHSDSEKGNSLLPPHGLLFD